MFGPGQSSTIIRVNDAFVILLHTGWGADHFDVMVADGPHLVTWQVVADPADLAIGASVPARALPNHRPVYLTYEGPVSRRRGHVRRVAAGTYDCLARTADRWHVRLTGERWAGEFELTRDSGSAWTLTRLA